MSNPFGTSSSSGGNAGNPFGQRNARPTSVGSNPFAKKQSGNGGNPFGSRPPASRPQQSTSGNPFGSRPAASSSQRTSSPQTAGNPFGGRRSMPQRNASPAGNPFGSRPASAAAPRRASPQAAGNPFGRPSTSATQRPSPQAAGNPFGGRSTPAAAARTPAPKAAATPPGNPFGRRSMPATTQQSRPSPRTAGNPFGGRSAANRRPSPAGATERPSSQGKASNPFGRPMPSNRNAPVTKAKSNPFGRKYSSDDVMRPPKRQDGSPNPFGSRSGDRRPFDAGASSTQQRTSPQQRGSPRTDGSRRVVSMPSRRVPGSTGSPRASSPRAGRGRAQEPPVRPPPAAPGAAAAAAAAAAATNGAFRVTPVVGQDVLGFGPPPPGRSPRARVRIWLLAVSNNVVVAAPFVAPNRPQLRLLRWWRTRPRGQPRADAVEIEHREFGEQIHKLFLDPTGFHVLVSLASGATFYAHAERRFAIRLKDKNLMGRVVESVAWDRLNGSPNETKTILLGARDGSILATSIPKTVLGKGKSKPKKNAKTPPVIKLYTICSSQQSTLDTSGGGAWGAVGGDMVTGLYFAHFPGSNTPSLPRLFVMAITSTLTSTRLYQFIGGPDLVNLFAGYAAGQSQSGMAATSGNGKSRSKSRKSTRQRKSNSVRRIPEALRGPFQEHFSVLPIPSGTALDLTRDVLSLRLLTFQRDNGAATPQLGFLLRTGVGLCYGKVLLGNQMPGDSTMCVVNQQMLFYDDLRKAQAEASGSSNTTPPLAATGTEFHLLMLYPDRVEVLNKLSQAIVFTHRFVDVAAFGGQMPRSRPQRMLGLCLDRTARDTLSARASLAPGLGRNDVVWLFSESGIFALNLIGESESDAVAGSTARGSPFQVSLERAVDTGLARDFDAALKHAVTEEQAAQIRVTQAASIFAHGRWAQAAQRYAPLRLGLSTAVPSFLMRHRMKGEAADAVVDSGHLSKAGLCRALSLPLSSPLDEEKRRADAAATDGSATNSSSSVGTEEPSAAGPGQQQQEQEQHQHTRRCLCFEDSMLKFMDLLLKTKREDNLAALPLPLPDRAGRGVATAEPAPQARAAVAALVDAKMAALDAAAGGRRGGGGGGGSSGGSKVARTALAGWSTELQLELLHDARRELRLMQMQDQDDQQQLERDERHRAEHERRVRARSVETVEEAVKRRQRRRRITSRFNEAKGKQQALYMSLASSLKDRRADMDLTSTCSLLAAHGCTGALIQVCRSAGQVARVVGLELMLGQTSAALATLSVLDQPEKHAPLFYRYAGELLRQAPGDIVDIWLSKPWIDPLRLLPMLVKSSHRRALRLRKRLQETRSQRQGKAGASSKSSSSSSRHGHATLGRGKSGNRRRSTEMELLRDVAWHGSASRSADEEEGGTSQVSGQGDATTKGAESAPGTIGVDHAARFLEQCILRRHRGHRHPAVHTALLHMYAEAAGAYARVLDEQEQERAREASVASANGDVGANGRAAVGLYPLEPEAEVEYDGALQVLLGFLNYHRKLAIANAESDASSAEDASPGAGVHPAAAGHSSRDEKGIGGTSSVAPSAAGRHRLGFRVESSHWLLDMPMALRACRREKLWRACVVILAALGPAMHEETVRMALRLDVPGQRGDSSLALAKENANVPKSLEERKRLWVLIATHVMTRQDLGPETAAGEAGAGSGMRAALRVARESGIVRIQDLLPHVPPEVRLDEINDDICATLQDMGTRLLSLKSEMRHSAKVAHEAEVRVTTRVNMLESQWGGVGARSSAASSSSSSSASNAGAAGGGHKKDDSRAGAPLLSQEWREEKKQELPSLQMRCRLTNEPLGATPGQYFIFPCAQGCVFERDALVAEMKLHLSLGGRSRIAVTEAALALVDPDKQAAATALAEQRLRDVKLLHGAQDMIASLRRVASANARSAKKKEKRRAATEEKGDAAAEAEELVQEEVRKMLRMQLDAVVAKHCLFCGASDGTGVSDTDTLMESVFAPLVAPQEASEAEVAWHM